MSKDAAPQLRLLAFAERPAQEKSGPIQLQVYIVNESPANLAILNDLDSINIPEGPNADLTHIDFGASGSAAFIQVPPGECLKITLLLNQQQLDLLARVKQMKATVKFRNGADEKAEVTTLLLPATVYKTNP